MYPEYPRGCHVATLTRDMDSTAERPWLSALSAGATRNVRRERPLRLVFERPQGIRTGISTGLVPLRHQPSRFEQ